MADEIDLLPQIAALSRPREERIARLAELQHGIVARWQLIDLGGTRHTVQDGLDAGRLHRIHRGVYSVGHARPTPRGRWLAAVLACGPGAVLSHRSAAALWDIRPSPPVHTGIEVTAPGRSRRGREGIALHSVRRLDRRDRATLDGIPVTSLHRTLLDYAKVAPPRQLAAAFEAAERQDLLDLGAVDELLARNPGCRGAGTLRTVADAHRGPGPDTRSELEARFLGLIREAGLPEPAVNVVVAGLTVDFYWPEARLVVEVDGWGFHRSHAAFDADRDRDVRLHLAGCDVLRFTKPGLDRAPDAVESMLAISAAGGRGVASGR
jgi:predicted transcriptional regulator of viral defense system